MMKEQLFNLIGKYRFNISIYTKELFERRCQEEIIRSDEDDTSFVYLEFNFDQIARKFETEEDNLKFWKIFLEALAKNNRGCDIIGFLENEAGLGMLLLDSKIEGWWRVRGRIEQTANMNNFPHVSDIFSTLVVPIVYPACIQDMQQKTATAST